MHLLLDEDRHITLDYNPKPNPSSRIYAQSLRYHLFRSLWNLPLLDIFTYPAFRSAPTTLGSPFYIGGNFYSWRAALASQWNLPEIVVQAFLAFNVAATTYCGMLMSWHAVAFIFIASGLWVDEECPDIIHKAWLADSVNDLWGKRYHQASSLYIIQRW